MILTFSWHFLQYCEIEDTLHPYCKVWQSDVCLEAVSVQVLGMVPNRMPLCVQCESMPNHPLIYLPTFVSLSHSLDKVTKCLTRLMTEPFARLCLFVGVVYLKWSHSPPHPSVLIPHPTPPFPPLPSPITVQSDPRLGQSWPITPHPNQGAGWRRWRASEGPLTRYRFEWQTSLTGRHEDNFHVPELDIIHNRRPPETVLCCKTEGGGSARYSLCYLCNATGHSSLLAFHIWTKYKRSRLVLCFLFFFFFTGLVRLHFSHFVSDRLMWLCHHNWVQILYVYWTRVTIQLFAVLLWYIGTHSMESHVWTLERMAF